MLHPAALRDLRTFRSELYGCFVRRAEALFELVDALLASDALPSLAHLSVWPRCDAEASPERGLSDRDSGVPAVGSLHLRRPVPG